MEYNFELANFKSKIKNNEIFDCVVNGIRFKISIKVGCEWYVFSINSFVKSTCWIIHNDSESDYRFIALDQGLADKVMIDSFISNGSIFLTAYTVESVQKWVDMWNDVHYSDIVVEVGQEEFRLHKCMLATKSPVLKAEIDAANNQKLNRIKLDKFDGPLTASLLRFIYTGNYDTIGCESIDNVWDAANYYGVSQLKVHCELQMATQLTKENCVHMLKSAVEKHQPHLKIEVEKYLRKYSQSVIRDHVESFDILAEGDWLDVLDRL